MSFCGGGRVHYNVDKLKIRWMSGIIWHQYRTKTPSPTPPLSLNALRVIFSYSVPIRRLRGYLMVSKQSFRHLDAIDYVYGVEIPSAGSGCLTLGRSGKFQRLWISAVTAKNPGNVFHVGVIHASPHLSLVSCTATRSREHVTVSTSSGILPVAKLSVLLAGKPSESKDQADQPTAANSKNIRLLDPCHTGHTHSPTN